MHMSRISRREALRGFSVSIISILTGGCLYGLGQSRSAWYVHARVVTGDYEEYEITEYSNEQVQQNKFARELVPKAAERGSARMRAPDAGKDAIDDLPTQYIRYDQQIVLLEMLTEE